MIYKIVKNHLSFKKYKDNFIFEVSPKKKQIKEFYFTFLNYFFTEIIFSIFKSSIKLFFS